MTLYSGQRLTTDAGHEVLIRGWRGEGSYSRLYQGTYLIGGRAHREERECAVKLARAEVEAASANLERERQALRRGRFERVVELLDSGTARTPYLVLSWIEGAPLREVMSRRRQLPLVDAARFACDIARGIASLHEAGIAHADLRADNVLVMQGDRAAVLTDLGSATFRGEPAHIDALRADIRRLGALFHLMLTGALPPPGGSRITAAAGYHRAAIALVEASGTGADLASVRAAAEALLDELGALSAAGRR
jgi:serine/threonine protein kinase